MKTRTAPIRTQAGRQGRNRIVIRSAAAAVSVGAAAVLSLAAPASADPKTTPIDRRRLRDPRPLKSRWE